MSEPYPPATGFHRAVAEAVRILIVDDHELLRDGLRELLSNKDDLCVCGEATGEDEAMDVVCQSRPDLVLVDLALKQGDGISLVRRIIAHNSATKVVVCSMHDEKLYAERALRAGASGYVHKQSPARAVLDAIRRVVAGKTYLSPEMTRRLQQPRSPESSSWHSVVDLLADRELEVFTLIGNGLMSAKIADQLGLSPRTVDTYRERLKSKLNLKTAGELNRRAVEWVLENT